MATNRSVPPALALPGMSATGTLLVRHGQSDWNALRRWQGAADIELTALGRAQATDACTNVLKGLERTIGRHVIAVTHSGVIRGLCRHLGAVDERVPNLGGVWVHRGHDGLRLGGRFNLLDLPVDASLDASVGLDGPGEDPGDETDDADDKGRAERGAAR
jgi:Histidine phosphatase superfamily (branch 1)